LIDNPKHTNSICTFGGDGLQKAQIGIKTLLTIDTHVAYNSNDDARVIRVRF
jgi:hypothetical protein